MKGRREMKGRDGAGEKEMAEYQNSYGGNKDTCTHLVKLLQEMETNCAGEVGQGSVHSRGSKQMQQILLLLNKLYIR